LKNIAGENCPNPPERKPLAGVNLLPKNGVDACQGKVKPDTLNATITVKNIVIAQQGYFKGNEKRNRNSIRCSFCGSLCETNSFKEHVFFCKQEHNEKSAKIAKPPLIKILKVKKTIVSEEIKEARRIERKKARYEKRNEIRREKRNGISPEVKEAINAKRREDRKNGKNGVNYEKTP